MPEADTAASHPAGPATIGQASNAATTSPPTCATAISGTATRFSSGPASVTRENDAADTGISAISTATEAADRGGNPDEGMVSG